MSPLEERRQRAREAGQDVASVGRCATAIDAAIETATRVKWSDELLDAIVDADDRLYPNDGVPYTDMGIALLRAAGFEVEQ